MSLIKRNGSDTGFPELPLLADFFDAEKFFESTLPSFIRRKLDLSSPAVNIREGDSEYDIEVMAPGFRKEDFRLNVTQNVLTIGCEREEEKKDGDKRYTRREYSFNSFSRSFTLPENTNADAIAANYTDGVLRIVIPKNEASRPSAREISIG